MHTIAQALLMPPLGEPGTLRVGFNMATASGISVPNIGLKGGNMTSPDGTAAYINNQRFEVDRRPGALGNDWGYSYGSPISMVGIAETVETWLQFNGAGFGELVIFEAYASNRSFKVDIDDSGVMRMFQAFATLVYSETDLTKFQGIAHHYAASKSAAGNWQFFLDGVAVGAPFTMGGTLETTSIYLSMLGAGPATAQAWRVKYRSGFAYTSPFTPAAT